jgi:hypothetical protein
MNLPAASHGVSVKDKFNPNAASCGELNPADFAISTFIHYNLCNLRNLWIKKNPNRRFLAVRVERFVMNLLFLCLWG